MIEVNNLTNTKVNENKIKKIAKTVLTKEKRKDVDLSIVLVSSEVIKKINKKYRKKDKATDVLAFEVDKVVNYNINQNFKIPENIRKSGEIILCPDVIKKNALRFGSSFEKEFNKVLIHGVLHTLGEDHKKTEERKRMEKKQEYYLNLFLK
jgi:probable rRNA maturation factor